MRSQLEGFLEVVRLQLEGFLEEEMRLQLGKLPGGGEVVVWKAS